MRHFPHHIGDYAAATAHLSFVEDAAYHRLLRRYYQDEKALPAEQSEVCRLVGARSAQEKTAVQTVLREFFDLREDGWHNRRADREIEAYQSRAGSARENGKRGGRPKPTDNRSGSSWDTQQEPSGKLTNNQEPITNERKDANASQRNGADNARHGTRLPEEWRPSSTDCVFAQDLGLDAERIGADFRDYWRAQPGQRGRKADWSATWRTWCRRAAGQSGGGPRPPNPAVTVDRDSDSQWQARLRKYRPGGMWIEGDWGPRPESGRSRVPAHILTAWETAQAEVH